VLAIILIFNFCKFGTSRANEYSKFQNSNIENVCLSYNTHLNFDSLINDVKVKCIEDRKDSIKNVLIDEVEKYIFEKAPKVYQNLPEYLVHKSLEENIDLCFVMAQTELETNYGTLGLGRESSRRSLFGVMKGKYSSYEDAVDDYFYLLKKSYLVKGRDEQYLMRNYVTGSGYRYAGNPHYEVELSSKYKIIKKTTNISQLIEDYKNII
jgi:flagellum-specific peptidoglycan hydrolase FlgJ